MKSLVDNGIVESYGPLVDVKGSCTAQFEHVWFPLRKHYFPRLTKRFRQFYFIVVGRKLSVVVTIIRPSHV